MMKCPFGFFRVIYLNFPSLRPPIFLFSTSTSSTTALLVSGTDGEQFGKPLKESKTTKPANIWKHAVKALSIQRRETTVIPFLQPPPFIASLSSSPRPKNYTQAHKWGVGDRISDDRQKSVLSWQLGCVWCTANTLRNNQILYLDHQNFLIFLMLDIYAGIELPYVVGFIAHSNVLATSFLHT